MQINPFRNRTCETIDKLSELAKKNKPDSDFFPTGFPFFDQAMDGGLRGGELITISGMTGEGKTTIAQQIGVNLSNIGVPSLWLSYEMGLYYLQEKFKKISQEDLSLYAPISLISNEIKVIEEWITEGLEEKACKVVFIDHLHYLIPLGGTENSSMLVGGVVRELKRLAVRTNTIIFLIAHTKKIYQGEELNLSSIRDSSLVAQESDYVFLIKRGKYLS
jgi:replicative DNA helicase